MRIQILLFTVALYSCNATGQTFKDLKINPGRYKIAHEDSVIDYLGGVTVKINSDLKLNDFSTYPNFSDIRLCEAKLKGDTLIMNLTGGNESIFHQYKIKIIQGKYLVTYRFLISGGGKTEVKCDNFDLVINSSDFKVGKEIRGFTEYHGKCLEGCVKKNIDIKGNFKVIINSFTPGVDHPYKW